MFLNNKENFVSKCLRIGIKRGKRSLGELRVCRVQEVQFQEINLLKIFVDTTLIMRSKVFEFIKLHLWLIFKHNYYPPVLKKPWISDCTCEQQIFQEIRVKNNAFQTFYLLKNLLVKSTIRRSKVDYNAFLTFDLLIKVSTP